MPGSDHDILQQVDLPQPGGVHPEQPVYGGGELQFSLLHLTADHVLVLAQGAQPLGGVVLMDHAGDHLPDIQVFLPHGQQYRDVLLPDHMALPEPGVLILPGDDLGHIVAEDVPYRVLCTDQLHSAASLMISTGSPARTVPSFRTATKMPSVGMTQVPAAFLMAQSLWHSLPI